MMRKQLHGVPMLELRSPDGASAAIADHGAHLLSWTPIDGGPALYLSERSRYDELNAIRGGVPIIFPQFGERGTGKRHGFARVRPWRLDFAGIEQERAVARYSLRTEDVTGVDWPHQFDLGYEIVFAAQELHMSLTVHNPAVDAWEFAAALHTYLHVDDLAVVTIDGLQNNDYIDQAKGATMARQDTALLRIDNEIDRIYLAVAKPIVLSDGDRVITIRKQGFSDVVVWNPGSEKAAELADMAPNDYRSFVCVEAAAVAKLLRLGQGETWRGMQSVTIGRK